MIAFYYLLVLVGILFVLYLGYKLPKKYFKSTIVGVVGVIIVFGVLFGDHIYNYSKYRYICATQTINKVYDQEAYDLFMKNRKTKRIIELKGNELEDIMTLLDISDYSTSPASFDKENGFLYFSMKQNKENVLRQQIININTGEIIYDFQNYYGGRGGWLCKLTNIETNRCNFDSCRTANLGAFK